MLALVLLLGPIGVMTLIISAIYLFMWIKARYQSSKLPKSVEIDMESPGPVPEVPSQGPGVFTIKSGPNSAGSAAVSGSLDSFLAVWERDMKELEQAAEQRDKARKLKKSLPSSKPKKLPTVKNGSKKSAKKR